MKIRVLLTNLMVLTLLSYGAWAQKSPKTMRATYKITSEYVRDIPALSQMSNIISAQGMGHVAPPKRRGTNHFVAGKGLPAAGDPLAQKQLDYQKAASTKEWLRLLK